MEDENCTDCGEPLDGELIRVGEPVEVDCSIGENDKLGAIILQHPDTGEQRVCVESLEDFTADDMRDAWAERLAECVINEILYVKVMLFPTEARRFGAALLRMADDCEGVVTTSGIDWNTKELG